MKKHLGFLVLAGALALAPHAAQAQALVEHGLDCGPSCIGVCVAYNATLTDLIFLTKAVRATYLPPVYDGGVLLTCRGQTDPPGRLVQLDYASTGLLAGCNGDPTPEWLEVITPSGQVTVWCHAVTAAQ